ncbi:polyphosphate polymerase domain-containing protein [Pseudokineococcus basanitobsidens]|uniref:Polyphosphate polymerase domain-containing protein n=1 Tax=Pseudokineococcus basanitobsidens TaxID=1926649 RepID=A0ABU8RKZ2_9ACTN
MSGLAPVLPGRPVPSALAQRLAPALDRFAPISLDELVAAASLQTRTDRKYLLDPRASERLLGAMEDRAVVLDTGGRRAFGYESVYVDTPDLLAYRAAAHGRRRRFKVRTRTYLDTGECVLEVKTQGGRGETVKERRPHPLADRDALPPDAERFVRTRVGPLLGDAPLRPVLTTTYARSTLLDREAGARLTCDVGLVCTGPDGDAVVLDDHVLVETKSAGAPGAADRWLWSAGVRPVTISKYCVGLACLRPELPANRWHRTLRRYFGR